MQALLTVLAHVSVPVEPHLLFFQAAMEPLHVAIPLGNSAPSRAPRARWGAEKATSLLF